MVLIFRIEGPHLKDDTRMDGNAHMATHPHYATPQPEAAP
jgi:hypothetical protein